MIDVIKPGALSTLQDLGRYGYQRYGVLAGGVMDEGAHCAANLLATNAEGEATLEVTLMGPSLKFRATTLIAICGADLSPRIGEHPVPQGRPVLVRAGSQLDFGRRERGMRAYLAVHGGFAVAPVMGSKGTYLRGGFGGFHGRALRKGDELPVAAVDAQRPFPRLARLLRDGTAPFASFAEPVVLPAVVDNPPQTIRVMRGQQWDAFTAEAQTQFVAGEYRINPKSDRMGFRLDGPALALRAPLEMISEAVAFGTIQVPPDGKPIILMADRQTTGGYPKIACVASVDLPLLAQAMPQQGLRFAPISLEEAQRLYVERITRIAGLRAAVLNLAQEI